MRRFSKRSERAILAVIVLVYIVLGILYAVMTPPWQVPDEPAHYNYVRFLVQERRLPVLSMGDYDQGYLDEATSRRFDPALSIDPIRYESHQPPLYYLLAMPVYVLFRGALIPLRLFSVLLGAGLPIVAYLVGKQVYPDQAWPGLGAAAFVALIPQHVAMSAGVENDVLAELILGLVLLELVRWLSLTEWGSIRRLTVVGVLVGLGLLTKISAYIAIPLALIAVLLKLRQAAHQGPSSQSARTAGIAVAALLIPALILSLPWFIRNVAVYGHMDLTGLKYHDRIVVGQLRTQDWIAEHGWVSLPGAFLSTTFHSFWAQFGWMAVPIDARIYTALGMLSLLVCLGFVLWLIDAWDGRRRPTPAGILLACSALFTLASLVWYNLGLYQAQGRYLFPALIPLGIAWSLGLHQILGKQEGWLIGIVLALVTGLGVVRCLLRVCDDKWRVLTTGLGAAVLGGRRFLPDWAGDSLFAATHVLLAALCAVSPFWFIAPYLTP